MLRNDAITPTSKLITLLGTNQWKFLDSRILDETCKPSEPISLVISHSDQDNCFVGRNSYLRVIPNFQMEFWEKTEHGQIIVSFWKKK